MIPAISNASVQALDMLERAVHRASELVPPLWPLATSVAVNPFLGQSAEGLAAASARLRQAVGETATMSRRWYAEAIASGRISQEDLSGALQAAEPLLRPKNLKDLIVAASEADPAREPIPTIADLAAEASGVDWSGFIAERFGAWAGGYFDQGQALWTAPRGKSAYAAWRAVATHDLTPEIVGLAGFATFVSEAPETALGAISQSVARLGLEPAGLEAYFHQLLMTLGGWAQYARRQQWLAQRDGNSDAALMDFLAVRLLWEQALFERYEALIEARWSLVKTAHATPLTPGEDEIVCSILQEALERGAQRRLAAVLAAPAGSAALERPSIQAAFCIDVRSEVLRRALEVQKPDIQTLGYAGFFGLAAKHRPFASLVDELRMPVLLSASFESRASEPQQAAEVEISRVKARAKRAWGRFKLAAVSSFAFVEASGPLYAGKLLRDALGLHSKITDHDHAPDFDPTFDIGQKAAVAEGLLRGMSLTHGFARLVLLIGHGSSVVNNPQGSGLQCGACGGYAGDVNARLAAKLLNLPEVRKALVQRGVEIPSDVLFLAGVHDTVTDEVSLFVGDHPSEEHGLLISEAKEAFRLARAAAAFERAARLPRAGTGDHLSRRGADWSEVRPEWGLAGCQAFIAAPRHRTRARNLEGRAFLHDYRWTEDPNFSVLEGILTAPVVVASWISLQYYGSTVAPLTFGAGNKLLHNVVGGVGVLEGNGGRLRGGLAWQSIHDGEALAHEPQRLAVCVEAPKEAIAAALERHQDVRALFENRWMHLFALDGEGRMAWRYKGGSQWEDYASIIAPAEQRSLELSQ